jgi:conjugal transfer/type IV secretion protein DotA/TraY
MALPTSTTVPASDLSARILDTMFGTGWENLITGQPNDIATGMVFPIMEGFNTVALTGISILFTWIMAVGVLGTAHEGKALGKRYSTLWTPIRGALSVSLLAPVVKGMSLFQVALLILVGWSINLGNFVWDAGISAFVSQGGMLVSSPPPQLQENADDLAASILKNQVVQAYFHFWEDKGLPNTDVYTTYENNDTNEYIIQFNAPENAGFENEAMGKIILSCPPNGICSQRRDAIRQLISDTMHIADGIVDPDQNADTEALISAVEQYGESVMSAMREHSASLTELTDELNRFKDQAVSSGWATAGAYYFSISRINERRRAAIEAGANKIEPNISVVSSHTTTDFEPVMAAYETYIRDSILRNSPSTISET